MKILKTIKIPVNIVNLYKDWSKDLDLQQKGELKTRPVLPLKVSNFLESVKEDIDIFSLCELHDMFGDGDEISTFDNTFSFSEDCLFTEVTVLKDNTYEITRYKK